MWCGDFTAFSWYQSYLADLHHLILYMASSTPFSSLSFNTMVHLLIIKSSFSDYLLWRSQVLSLLQSQHLFGYVDGSVTKPSIIDSSGSENPELVEWQQTSQLLLSLLLSSLTEEAMSTVVGLSSSHDIWYTLENTFSHRS
jgi:hypothetical protein